MKVVLDTNVLVSGITGPSGSPGQIVSAWLDGDFDLVVSEELLDEFKRVLLYPKIQKLLTGAGLLVADLDDYIDILRLKVFPGEVSKVALPIEPADVNDRHVLVALIVSGTDYLVTGDKKHLLSLGMKNIVTAKVFADRLRALKTITPAVAHAQNVVARIKKKRNLIAKKSK